MKNRIVAFASKLGWMAIVGSGDTLLALTFGHVSAKAAIAALPPELPIDVKSGRWNPPIVRRLQRYAAGKIVDFSDVPVDPGPLTPFERRVIQRCRAVPYGVTTTYARLASDAGHPRAARAVGNCMAANRLPLVIPCHRVVPSGAGLGGYSGAQGVKTKRQLIDMDAAAIARLG